MLPWNEFGVDVNPENKSGKLESDQMLFDKSPRSIMSDY
jgi:hypothetical protein